MAIEALRNAGHVRAQVLEEAFASPELAALAFGLKGEPAIYSEVSPKEAACVLRSVIHRDMAYEIELVPLGQAEELAAKFLQAVGTVGARYFTNGTFGLPRQSPHVGASWSPATEATFDTGILVLTPERTACLWFEDED
ncbi:hypothetical protein KAK07_25015 [Ideonella sp. 4Y16]|uniref:hypothetical protein n=1 Tax=Ideonella alba TaxID=2824118 RepID=UPI001B36D960|nr:hypothetical protein [Ideonella alba]MBQ0946611.1 hypothetical protein [Ideonella alba]